MNAIARAVPPNLEAAAARLAGAEVTLSTRRSAVTAARAEEQRILGRIADLDARRSAIAARRAAGNGRPEDGGELELITLDRTDLDRLLTDARAAVSGPQEEARRAEQIRESARRDLERIEHEIAIEELRAHAVRLDGALTQTIALLNERTRALGGTRPVWLPSDDLKERLRRLALHILA